MTFPLSRNTPLRVLVADADPRTRLLVVAVLAELGHEPEIAVDGAEAWERFHQTRPDLVVLATDLPKLNGLEVCRRVRESDGKREIFVFFLTSRDQPETLEQILDAGGDEFIAKPMTPEDLRARLIVARRRMMQDTARRRAEDETASSWRTTRTTTARRRAEDELSRTRWMSGIGEATLALQHEINNPLSALLGNAELLMMELEDRGERSELLEIIHEQGLRIAEVVRRLRRLKNPESVDYVGGSRMLNLWKEHTT